MLERKNKREIYVRIAYVTDTNVKTSNEQTL